MNIFTIGFAGKGAEEFFETLKRPYIIRVIDVRLGNASRLAGFTRKKDLPWLLDSLCGIGYMHCTELAPTKHMMNEYRKSGKWDEFQKAYLDLLAARGVENMLNPESVSGSCLLCAEPSPDRCHRRLAAEYLQRTWRDVTIHHL